MLKNWSKGTVSERVAKGDLKLCLRVPSLCTFWHTLVQSEKWVLPRDRIPASHTIPLNLWKGPTRKFRHWGRWEGGLFNFRAFQIKNSKIKVSYFKPHHFGKFLVFHSFWCNTCFTNLNTFPLMPIFIVGGQISCLYFLNFQKCCSLESPLSIENKKYPMEWCIQAIFKVIFSSFHFKKLVWVFVIK